MAIHNKSCFQSLSCFGSRSVCSVILRWGSIAWSWPKARWGIGVRGARTCLVLGVVGIVASCGSGFIYLHCMYLVFGDGRDDAAALVDVLCCFWSVVRCVTGWLTGSKI